MDVFDDFGFAAAPEPAAASARPQSAPGAQPPVDFVPHMPIQPVPVPASARPSAPRSRAGVSMLLAAAGAAAGGVLGGPVGIGIGLAGVGAARNLYRAQGIASSDPAQQGAAARNLALGVVGLGIAWYLAYKLYSKDKDDD